MISAWDLSILHFFNQFAGEHDLLDKIIFFISKNHLFKGGVFVVLLWTLWFDRTHKKTYRPLIVLNVLGCFLSMFIVRILAICLPYRPRPIYESLIEVAHPIGMPVAYASTMSSFPSDHAGLFFALATSIYFISKRLGIVAFMYAFFVISLPRIYLGLHYPSDILIGAFIGIGMITSLNSLNNKEELIAPFFKLKKGYPGIFYAALFLITYQIADMFESVRAVLSFAHSLIE